MLPERIGSVRPDYVALDLKLAPGRYAAAGAPPDASDRVRRALAAVRSSGALAEYRTTVVPGLVAESDIRAIVALLLPGERYTLARFRAARTLDPAFARVAEPDPWLLERYASIARQRGLHVTIRA